MAKANPVYTSELVRQAKDEAGAAAKTGINPSRIRELKKGAMPTPDEVKKLRKILVTSTP